MPRLLIMSDLILAAQRRADMEGDGVIKPPEWKQLAGEAYGPLYSAVVSAGMRYFESTATITATGAASYDLPSDHDETIGIDRVIDPTTGRAVELGEVMVQERNRLTGLTGDARGYAIVGQQVVLYPTPPNGTYIHVYVPQAPSLGAFADTASVDVVTIDGEGYMINAIAALAIRKRDGDPGGAIGGANAALALFSADVQRRALINPRRRVVARTPFGMGWDDGDPFAFDPGSWAWRHW